MPDQSQNFKKGLTIGPQESNPNAIIDQYGNVRFDGDVNIQGNVNFDANVELDNNDFLKGKDTGGTLKRLIGVNTSNLVAIDPDALGATFGGSVTVGSDLIVSTGKQVSLDGSTGGSYLTEETADAVFLYVGGRAHMLWEETTTDSVRSLVRFKESQGTSVASANTLTLGDSGNLFSITGTTQINLITTTGWTVGSEIKLAFNGEVTVAHGQTATGATAAILMGSAGNYLASANYLLALTLTSTSSQVAWVYSGGYQGQT